MRNYLSKALEGEAIDGPFVTQPAVSAIEPPIVAESQPTAQPEGEAQVVLSGPLSKVYADALNAALRHATPDTAATESAANDTINLTATATKLAAPSPRPMHLFLSNQKDTSVTEIVEVVQAYLRQPVPSDHYLVITQGDPNEMTPPPFDNSDNVLTRALESLAESLGYKVVRGLANLKR